jgi:TRAP-type uncharacterized transport system substrate-binding protein
MPAPRIGFTVQGPEGLGRVVLKAIVVGLVGVVVVAALVISVGGRPPRDITIASGAEGGAYQRFAQRLQAVLARRGFRLHILETAGSIENARLIQQGRADIGLVQSGTDKVTGMDGISALAELFYEPIWIWYRTDALPALDDLSVLAGHPVAGGEEGSGTHAIVSSILAHEGSPAVQRVEASATETEQMLLDGRVDAGVIVAAADAPVVLSLAEAPDLSVYQYTRAEAFARHLPYLSAVPIASGVLDIDRDVPPRDGEVLAARATLVGEAGLHPDLARLLVTVAPDAIAYPLIGDPQEFPSLLQTQFARNEEAQRYLTEGETPLERFLPWDIASPLSRYYVLLLPIVLLLYPLWHVAKAAYAWYQRRKIVGWYPRIYAIERGLPDATLPELALQQEFLRAIVAQVSQQSRVSAGYLAAYYDLRLNIAFVQRMLDQRIEELAASGGVVPATGPAAPLDPALVADPRRITDREMGIDDDLRAIGH